MFVSVHRLKSCISPAAALLGVAVVVLPAGRPAGEGGWWLASWWVGGSSDGGGRAAPAHVVQGN